MRLNNSGRLTWHKKKKIKKQTEPNHFDKIFCLLSYLVLDVFVFFLAIIFCKKIYDYKQIIIKIIIIIIIKKSYKYLDILEADTIKQVQMKDMIRKEYLRRTRTLLETKLSCRNRIKGINTWAVPLVRYLGPFLKWTREGLKQMDQRTRKLMTMHKTLHPRDDVDRLYVSRKEGRSGLARIEDTVDASIQRLEDYIEKHERGLISTIRVDTDNTINERMTTTRKQKWEGKQLYDRFKRLINNILHQKTWTWLRKGNLTRETVSLLIAAQDNAIRTNHIKARIDKTQQNSKWRLSGDRDETINHIISECSKLAHKEYKARHDWVGKVIQWEMCRKFQFDHTNKWYMHNPAPVQENDSHKLLWDFNIQTDHRIPARRPDLIIISKRKIICKIVDFTVPADYRIDKKENEKKDKYLDLARELKKTVEHESNDCANCDWCVRHSN